MNNNTKAQTYLPRWLFWLTLGVLMTGIVLSVISWLRICSQVCAAGHKYRLYGYSFEPIGISFFIVSAILWYFSRNRPNLRLIVGGLVSSALGAELMFTYAQKYIIGHWCPVCLSIATTVVVAMLLIAGNFFQNFRDTIARKEWGGIMKGVLKMLGAICMVAAGFLFAETGFAKFNKLQALEKDFQANVAFGDPESNIEVYVFTDWKCPACHKVFPIIEKSAPAIMEKARLMFIDIPIHDESLNFTPYNLSFMINNKKNYFQMRKALEEISNNSDAPTDEQIEEYASKVGSRYKQLNYADVAVGIKYFKHVAAQFDIEKTPTVVIINTKNKKGKKLTGPSEITEKGILNAIDAVSK
jgi:uncharacterized membrane protein